MPYIGRSQKFGVRTVFHFLASNGDTSVSGNDADGKALSFADGNYIDVYLNGVRLKSGEDYNTSTANTIAGLSALNANDEVNVVVYDAFSVADTVPASTGGAFSGAVSVTGDVTATGDVTSSGTVNVTGDTAAGDDASIGHTSAEGLILTGQGSTNDVTIKNDADTAVISIPTGGTAVDYSGNIKVLSGNIQFGASGSETGQVEINSTRLLARSTGDASGLRFDASAYTPFKNGSQANGTVDLGGSGGRYKDLFLAGGLYVGGTGAANFLDDFEEGNFDPTLKNEGDTNLSVTYVDAYNHARYVKIGTLVVIQFTVNISALSGDSGSQNLTINNLPFTSKGYADNSNGGFNVTYHVNMDTSPTFGMVLGSSTSLRFYSSGSTPLYSNALQSNSWFQGYGHYETAS